MKWNSKWTAVVVAGGIVVLVALFRLGSDSPKLRAEILSNHQIVKVKNLNDFDWSDTVVTLNGDYSQRVGWIGAGDTGTFPLERFTTSDGARFNGFSTKVKKVFVDAHTPKGDGTYYAESD